VVSDDYDVIMHRAKSEAEKDAAGYYTKTSELLTFPKTRNVVFK